MIEAGRLRHRLELQQPGPEVRATDGSEHPQWLPYATVWGSVSPLTGRELWQARQSNPDVTHRVVIRFQPGLVLLATHRIKHRGRYLNLMAVRDIDERLRRWEIDAVEVMTKEA